MLTRRSLIQTTAAGTALALATQAKAQGTGSTGGRYRIIGLEEHIVLPEMQAAWRTAPNYFEADFHGFGDSDLAQRLRNTGDRRLEDMDNQGVDMQVLSAMTPGVTSLPADVAIPAARDFNDALAGVVDTRPDRFQGFATLAMQDPDAAAEELERCVTQHRFAGAMIYGRIGDRKLDDLANDVIYATAARLGVPLHLHPQIIPQSVNEAYYTGINQELDFQFGGPGIGWYYDLGVQVLRMVLSGTFDRHPNLQIILGHWGEVVLFYLDHAQYTYRYVELERPFMDYFRQNMWVAGSGTQSDRYLRWATEVMGVDRMLYSTDYPLTFQLDDPYIETSNGAARDLIDRSPFTDAEKAAIGAGNWQRLIAPVTNAFEL